MTQTHTYYSNTNAGAKKHDVSMSLKKTEKTLPTKMPEDEDDRRRQLELE